MTRLAGDPGADSNSMIRVDHAGEYGAARIYAGQLAVMGTRGPVAGEIARMASQEDRHLKAFDRMIAERGVRPTLLMPVWHAAGFALGAVSALVGPKAAMAVTAAVETEIDRHYQAQRDLLDGSDPELEGMIAEFQAEEVEHRETAVAHGAEQAVAYPLMSAVIRAGCRAAIRVAEKI
ncbi:demethoxyubiquinone hydroxylase family protein [Sandaracinobacteroides hominis]|uniref:demethoxyubiquinone hydroxylase family protein n=1 Tax=Sandaracinobacteroides hominis TaxID=2780086 RepID=UPI001F250110|nr:demethoxyubiquinone hydroxylase family protein [Sandaracinobacteroides hominis]